jgi:DNA-binding MarR family transcriptional regulator
MSTAAVMFHTALAGRLGLSATEEKALDLLDRAGPLTAKELAERSGLAPPSVTALVRRLEEKGFATRRPHPSDGRRILIETSSDRLAGLTDLFTDWAAALESLYATFSDEQLETILHFLRSATELQFEMTTRLVEPEERLPHRSEPDRRR